MIMGQGRHIIILCLINPSEHVPDITSVVALTGQNGVGDFRCYDTGCERMLNYQHYKNIYMYDSPLKYGFRWILDGFSVQIAR
jgi:hypothetical protein